MTAGFFYKTRAYMVTFMAESAHVITDDELVAGIRLLAMESMYAEVVGVIETASVPGVLDTMPPNFFRDSRRILA